MSSARTPSTKRLCLLLLILAVLAPAASAEMLFGVTAANELVGFDSAMPEAVSSVKDITGVGPGEKIVGIDFRPRTGQLYGVGATPGGPGDTLRVYLIDASSGAATPLPNSTPFIVTAGAHYGVDFNPTVDRIRVVNSSEENFRINPNNGARADAPTPDTDLTAGQSIDAIAYDRSFESGLAAANRTTLYGISRTQNRLVTIGGINQSPSPNGGSVNPAGVGPLGHAISPLSGVGFDISGFDGTAFATWISDDGLAKLYTINLISGAATPVGTIGDGSRVLEGLAAAPHPRLVFGPEGRKEKFTAVDLQAERFTTVASAFQTPHKGGVRVAVGDVNGDGRVDYVVAPGKGRPPLVRAFDGRSGALLREFAAYAPAFTGGVFVAVGDVNGDGRADIITAPGSGVQTTVRVFSGLNGSVLLETDPFGSFSGGVTVAAADLDLDADADIVVGSGPGLTPEVRVLDGAGTTRATFSPYPQSFSSRGVTVAAGQLRTLNLANSPLIVTAPGKGSSEVKIFTSAITPLDFTEQLAFSAFPGANPGGVRVALADTNFDGLNDIIALPGPGRSAAKARIFSAADGALLRTFPALPGTSGGWVAAGR